MPFVTIRMVAGHSHARKDAIAERVTAAISEVTQLPKDAVWVVFEDVAAEEWHVGGSSVASRRAAASASS
jgi:4-oxalocrotonate tautomerase